MTHRANLMLRTVVSVSLIVVLLCMMRGSYVRILEIFKDINIAVFVYSVFIFFAAISIAAMRVRMLIRAQELSVTFIEAVNLTFIGYFFNNFLPTAIGGDVVKAYYVAKKTNNTTASFASVFMDRFLGLFTMMVMAGLALIFAKGFVKDQAAVNMVYGAVAVSVLLLAFIFHKPFASRFSFLFKLAGPLEGKLRHLYEIVHSYHKKRLLLLSSFILSFISQFIYFYSIFLLVTSIGSHVPFKELFLRIPLVSAFSLLPSINGLGVREGSIVVLFGPLVGKGNAFAVSILMLATLMITSLIGGVIYAVSPQFRIALKAEREGKGVIV